MHASMNGEGGRNMRNRLLGSLALAVITVLVASRAARAAESRDIVRLDQKAKPTEPGKYPKEMVRPGQKTFEGEFETVAGYRSTDKKFLVAIWQSGPGVLQTESYPNDEYVLVLEGELAITNKSGKKETFRPGDSFVIPKGWAGTWDMKTRFKKQFVAVYENAP
jgi:uncharacterized cupin superfamily protein